MPSSRVERYFSSLMKPCSRILFKTSLRRSSAASWALNGLYWDGACGSPASSADSSRSSSETCFEK